MKALILAALLGQLPAPPSADVVELPPENLGDDAQDPQEDRPQAVPLPQPLEPPLRSPPEGWEPEPEPREYAPYEARGLEDHPPPDSFISDARLWTLMGPAFALPGFAAFAPALIACGVAVPLLGAGYPLSGGDPTYSAWSCCCGLGGMLGLVGWGLAMVAAVVGPALTAGGMGLSALRPLEPPPFGVRARRALMVVVPVAATAVPALLLAVFSGGLPWFSLWVSASVGNHLPNTGDWPYIRWLGINVLFMGAVLVGFGHLVMAAALPTLAGLAGTVAGNALASDDTPAQE